MANTEDIALMAHLMRRAGFGATRTELEELQELGYEQTVERLLQPKEPPVDTYTLYRYHPFTELPGGNPSQGQANWLYHMVNTKRPLQEKMVLFWHHVFATAHSKVESLTPMLTQVQMFRDHGMGSYRELLIRLARDPAMIFWLDNNENHKDAPNENWGRELLELFSMGVGNYTEDDVFECSRAFTGWTINNDPPMIPNGNFRWYFEYRSGDHDDTEKSFLGHAGKFNGEDVVDTIVQQPACHRFISRHLYNFFVADEPQVPAWSIEPPRDPRAIEALSEAFVSSGYDIRAVLRTLFNSDFFKEAVYRKVRNPVEVVVGTLRLTGDLKGPDPRLEPTSVEVRYLGQDIFNPPSVEGWATGKEWINSGFLVSRVNFLADRMGNTELPGVRDLVDRVASDGTAISAEALVHRCLDLMGPMEVSEVTLKELVAQAESDGPIAWANDEERAALSHRVGEVLALIASSREYQFS